METEQIIPQDDEAVSDDDGLLSAEIRSLRALIRRVEKTAEQEEKLNVLLNVLEMHGHRNVHAWDLSGKPDPRALDVARYAELTIRAASNIFTPLGISEKTLRNIVLERRRCGDESGGEKRGGSSIPASGTGSGGVRV
jgi:hypothetical protein